MTSKHAVVFVLALALVGSALACSIGIPTGGPAAPCAVTPSKEAADRVAQRISEQASQGSGATVSVAVTNEEMTSLFVQALDEANRSNPQNAPQIQNPVVCFQGNQMKIFGGVKFEGQQPIDALIAVSATVKDGKAVTNVEQVQVGPIPLPEAARGQIAILINDALSKNLDRLTLTDIQITDGQMTVTGKVP